MKALQFIILFAFGLVLIYGVVGLPPKGDHEAPAQLVENPAGNPVAGTHYIQHAYEDTHTPNMITAVLADYRSVDTLGELIVVFAAGIACMYILRRRVI